ncbi:hypothetical protein FKP32DRAFT_1642762 [Trametes sanguinea]|nr:hypothetical protein FKP32DRAFT_1642762 [Trametes sanguinea]
MNANLNNIPLFQFPPSIESELEARGYTSSTHAAAVPMQQPHHPSYQHYDDTGTFLARRSSTSMIPQVARSQQPSHQFSNVPVRHYSSPLSAADVHGRQNATFRHPNDLQARPPIASSPFGASHPNRAGTFGTSTFAPPQPQLSVMQQTTEHAREQQQRAMMYTSPPPMISPEGIYQDHGMVKQEEPTTGICSDASSSASHMTAYSACQYPAKTAPSDERATQFDVYVQDGYEGVSTFHVASCPCVGDHLLPR